MLSDDDRPLVTKSAPNGHTHTGVSHVNGHVHGKQEDYSMSEDEDLPLVRTRSSHLYITHTQSGEYNIDTCFSRRRRTRLQSLCLHPLAT